MPDTARMTDSYKAVCSGRARNGCGCPDPCHRKNTAAPPSAADGCNPRAGNTGNTHTAWSG